MSIQMSDEIEQSLGGLLRMMYEPGRGMDEKMQALARFCAVFSADEIDAETASVREALNAWADAADKVDKALVHYQYTRWCEMDQGADKRIQDIEGYLDWSKLGDHEKLLALSLVVRDFTRGGALPGETDAMRESREAFAEAAAECVETFSGLKTKGGDSPRASEVSDE